MSKKRIEKAEKFSDFHNLDDVLRKDIITCLLNGVRESVLFRLSTFPSLHLIIK